MASTNRYTVPFRRKSEGKTDYKLRFKLLMSEKLRLVVRPSLKNISAQLVEYTETGDKIIVSAHSKELTKLGWQHNTGNISTAYLVGLLIGKKATQKGVKEAILDLGRIQIVKGSRSFALLKGVLDAGLQIPHNEKILPSNERLSGKHISEYAKTLKSDKDKFEKQFSKSLKSGADPEKLTHDFESMKKKIA